MARKLEEIESILLLDRHARANRRRIRPALGEEAEARYAGFQAGKSRAIDGDEVFRRARMRDE
jgi:hypothetical protein